MTIFAKPEQFNKEKRPQYFSPGAPPLSVVVNAPSLSSADYLLGQFLTVDKKKNGYTILQATKKLKDWASNGSLSRTQHRNALEKA